MVRHRIGNQAPGVQTPAQPHPDCAAQGNDLTVLYIFSLIFYIRTVVAMGENTCTWCSARYEVSAPKTLAAIKQGSIQKYAQ